MYYNLKSFDHEYIFHISFEHHNWSTSRCGSMRKSLMYKKLKGIGEDLFFFLLLKGYNHVKWDFFNSCVQSMG
jgi:hypothetical protein